MDHEWMTPDEVMLSSIHTHAPDILTQLQFVHAVNKQTLAPISRGMLFIHAAWSGSSVTALRKLNDVVKHQDTEKSLSIIITNTETYDHELKLIPDLTGKMHGNGEIAWIFRGQVTETKVGANVDDIESATQRLLTMATTA